MSLIKDGKYLVIEKLKVLVQFIRKLKINLKDFNEQSHFDLNKYISDDQLLKNFQNDENLLYWFCLTLKYLCRNSLSSSINLLEYINTETIAELMENDHSIISARVRNELVVILGYLIENLTENKIQFARRDHIKTVIKNSTEVCDDAKSLIMTRLEANQHLTNPKILKQDILKKNASYNKKINKKINSKVVTKSVQVVKYSRKSEISEMSEFKIENLINALKSREKKANINITRDSIQTVDDQSGNDRSMLRNTWNECKHFYQLASQGQKIKKDDKDKYLPSKLFGRHFFNFSTSSKCFRGFVLNRMIASTLLTVSKKQELSNYAIDQLMKCVTDFDDFVNNFVKVFAIQTFILISKQLC